MLDQLDKERLGGTRGQIRESKRQTKTGTTLKIDASARDRLIAEGVFLKSELTKQAELFIRPQKLMDKFFAAEAKRLGDVAKTEEGMLEARKGALSQFTAFVSQEIKRLDKTVLSGVSGLSSLENIKPQKMDRDDILSGMGIKEGIGNIPGDFNAEYLLEKIVTTRDKAFDDAGRLVEDIKDRALVDPGTATAKALVDAEAALVDFRAVLTGSGTDFKKVTGAIFRDIISGLKRDSAAMSSFSLGIEVFGSKLVGLEEARNRIRQANQAAKDIASSVAEGTSSIFKSVDNDSENMMAKGVADLNQVAKLVAATSVVLTTEQRGALEAATRTNALRKKTAKRSSQTQIRRGSFKSEREEGWQKGPQRQELPACF